MKARFGTMHLLVVAVVAAILLSACASIGRPQGGPRDEEPPRFASSNPAPGSLNVKNNKFTITFNENIQLEDAFNKVVVSPVQIQPPAVSSNARRVTIELRDTLIPNTTYSIDFADAIKDLNEGNVLDGFALDFATGDSIDTLRISGMVLEARTLEPAQGMLVGVHSNLEDSALKTLPFERIARTNQYGQFTIRNLKPGNYRVYALNDLNRDYKWDRSEDVAFYDLTVSPSVQAIEVCDTFMRDDGTDSLVTHPGVSYLPNDVLLTWFNEGYNPQYLRDYARPDRRRITIGFAAESDTLPEITIASERGRGRHIDEWAVAQVNTRRDSLVYWVTDTTIAAVDSLRLSVRYLKTDTAEQLAWQTDTLRFFFREQKSNKKKDKAAEDSVVVDSMGVPQPKEFLTFTATSTAQEVYKPLTFKASQPIRSIDASKVHLQMLVDSLWLPVEIGEFRPDSLDGLMLRHLDVEWEPGAKYRMNIDSTAVMGVFDQWNKPVKHEFTVRQLEEYSNLIFDITGVETDSTGAMPPIIVELLDGNDKVVRTVRVVDGKAEIKWINPSVYYARLFIDSNDNGKWDTGNMAQQLQPEEVYYYNKKITLKKNWDVQQTWDIYELALDAQKPMGIKKNKPKPKKGERNNQGQNQDDEEEYDEFGNPIDYNSTYDRNDRSNLNNMRPGSNSMGGRNNSGNNRRGGFNTQMAR